jgi:L-alanine-DL-glutamate epimerase-like enolase superfamily enzyme
MSGMKAVIDRIDVFVTDLPVRLQRTFSSGRYDTGPSREQLGKPVLVRLSADGVVGHGHIRPISPGHFVPDTTHSVVAAITELYAPVLLGRSIFDIESIHAALDRRLPGNPAARAAVDLALHDAVGHALQTPVYNLLGGLCQSSNPLEWSVSLAVDVNTMIEESRRAVETFGMRVLCIKAADHRGWRQDVRNFEAVRRAVGPDVVIGIDPNTGWTLPDALQAVHALRPFDVGYIEQPIARRDLPGLAEIRRIAQGVPVMADESLFTLDDALSLVQARAVDAFCIKLYKVGGFTAARKIAAVAEAGNVLLNCGGLAVQSQLEAAAAAHFYASTPAHRMMGAGEFVFGLNTTAPDPIVADCGFVVRNGCVDVPTAPGLGIVPDEAMLRRHTLRHEHLHR